MLSFGQRLKLIRKEAQITQAELAEKLMVSVQAVSKWECDNSMPDISQIVPLSAILGVTTDCLLGVGGDEKADRDNLYREIDALFGSSEFNNFEVKDENPDYISYKLCKEHIKKYPLDYEVKYRSAYYLYCFLYYARRHSFELENSLYNEALNLLNTIINYDRNTTRIIDAKVLLIRIYVDRGDFLRAEEIAEGLPRLGNVKSEAEIEIFSKKDDQEKCLAISKEICATAIDEYMQALWVRARRISIFGSERKREAILAWYDLLESAKFNYKRFNDIDTDSQYWWYCALNHLSNDYIAISEFGKALEIVEELTDTLIIHYNELKENGNMSLTNEFKSTMTGQLHRCYSWCFPNEDNIIAKDPRFKKCEERLLALD